MSPEMINHRVKGWFKYSLKTDIWGVGMVIAELMLLDYAFEYETEVERIWYVSKVKTDKLWKFKDDYPQWIKDLVLQMLSLD